MTLTAAEHKLIYRIRCELQTWGFPADDLPVELAVSGMETLWFKYTKHRLYLGRRVIHLWALPDYVLAAEWHYWHELRPVIFYPERLPSFPRETVDG